MEIVFHGNIHCVTPYKGEHIFSEFVYII